MALDKNRRGNRYGCRLCREQDDLVEINEIIRSSEDLGQMVMRLRAELGIIVTPARVNRHIKHMDQAEDRVKAEALDNRLASQVADTMGLALPEKPMSLALPSAKEIDDMTVDQAADKLEDLWIKQGLEIDPSELTVKERIMLAKEGMRMRRAKKEAAPSFPQELLIAVAHGNNQVAVAIKKGNNDPGQGTVHQMASGANGEG